MPKRPTEDYQLPHADTPADRPELSPLELILKTMHERYCRDDIDGAIALARFAAPYLHPRPTPTKIPTDLASMTDAELDALRHPD